MKGAIKQNSCRMEDDKSSKITGSLEPSSKITVQLVVDAIMQISLLIQFALRRGGLLSREEGDNGTLVHDPEPKLVDHEHLSVHEGLWQVLEILHMRRITEFVFEFDCFPCSLPEHLVIVSCNGRPQIRVSELIQSSPEMDGRLVAQIPPYQLSLEAGFRYLLRYRSRSPLL